MSSHKFVPSTLTRRGDARGGLVVAETGRDCPFDIRRVYWVFGTPGGVRRGFHSHLKTRQMAVCVSGACSFLMDDGTTREDVRLATPDSALMIEPGVWHEMYDFTPDCVLLVFADAPYDEADYVRDYSRFRELAAR